MASSLLHRQKRWGCILLRYIGGRLMKLNRGVFRLTAYPSNGLVSDMAALLATVGEGAYLCGESVLQLYDLCPTRSYVATVASPRRIRRTTIPKGVRVVKSEAGYKHPS